VVRCPNHHDHQGRTTAGHILDPGNSHIRRLTGSETDRLTESLQSNLTQTHNLLTYVTEISHLYSLRDF